MAERNVAIGLAADIENIGAVELRLVTISRS
jgi:hypothetical protein